MTGPVSNRPLEISRRSMMRCLSVAAGGVAILATIMNGARRAFAKSSQKAVGYQGTPHGAQRCDNCREFDPPSACKVVDGNIDPAGWCKVYIKKPSSS